jgi:hypothetical protein
MAERFKRRKWFSFKKIKIFVTPPEDDHQDDEASTTAYAETLVRRIY